MATIVTTYLCFDKEKRHLVLNDNNEVDFDILIPMPEEADTALWSLRNWGSRGNATNTFLATDYGEESILTGFTTIGHIPYAWLTALMIVCDYEIYSESTYDDDPTKVYDIDGKRIPEAEIGLFKKTYLDEDGDEISEEEYNRLQDTGRIASFAWE